MKLMFSIPVHECPEIIIDQIINYKFYNPDCGFILHISKTADLKWDNISEKDFMRIVPG